MARTVEGVFRSQAQAQRTLYELRYRGLDRDVTLAPRGSAVGQPGGGAPGWLGPEADVLTSGPAPEAGPEDWFQAPFYMKVTVSARRAPEVAQLLRQYGAEEVDVT